MLIHTDKNYITEFNLIFLNQSSLSHWRYQNETRTTQI